MIGLGWQEIIILAVIGFLFLVVVAAVVAGPVLAASRKTERAVTRAELAELRAEVERLREEIEHLKRGHATDAADGKEGIRAV